MLEAFPLYLAYMFSSVAMLAATVAIYAWITPYDELRLIRAGNTAAALSLGGTTIGLALPLWSVATYSYGLLDLVIWGGVALAFQVAAFYAATLLLKGFREGIEADRVGYGALLGAVSIAVGLVNAGSLAY
jgi:putative membrane protein